MVSASDSEFQVPNTPGLPAGTSPNGTPWLPGTFDSAALDENQHEKNAYGVVTYQKSAGSLMPDPVGDLYFNGVASDVDRKLISAGVQGDASYALSDAHTMRAGLMVLHESVTADSATTVFPVDDDGAPTGPAFRSPRALRRGIPAGRMEAHPTTDRQLRRTLRRL